MLGRHFFDRYHGGLIKRKTITERVKDVGCTWNVACAELEKQQRAVSKPARAVPAPSWSPVKINPVLAKPRTPGNLEQAAQDLVQVGLEHLQRRDSTTSLGSLFQGSVTLRGTNFFLMFRWNFLCLSLCPLPLRPVTGHH